MNLKWSVRFHDANDQMSGFDNEFQMNVIKCLRYPFGYARSADTIGMILLLILV